MKIEYRVTGSGGGYTVLADEGDAGDTTAPRITGYQPVFQKTPQSTAMFGAASKQVADVGNAVWSLAFLIVRTHASSGVARKHVSDQAVIFAAINTWDLKVTDGATVLTFAGSACKSVRPEPNSDLTTLIGYEFETQTYS